MLNKFASIIPTTPPKGLTQNQYDWFLRDSEEKEMSLAEILISYDMINQAQDNERCQGHTLRQWIIQEFDRANANGNIADLAQAAAMPEADAPRRRPRIK